ncbi:hypothetical protein OSL25_26530, partial [Escherichia coli]|nr:hypothetical protein [Escherichia coli]
TSIFSHPVYLFLRKFSLQDSRGGSGLQCILDYTSKVLTPANVPHTLHEGYSKNLFLTSCDEALQVVASQRKALYE